MEESEAERRSLADRFKTAEEEKREILGPQRSKEMELSSQLDTLRAKVYTHVKTYCTLCGLTSTQGHTLYVAVYVAISTVYVGPSIGV